MSTQVSRNDVVSSGNFALPDGIYTVRINTAERILSKTSGNPMIKFDAEIIEPETVEVGGAKYQVQGKTFSYYGILTTANNDGTPGGQIGKVFDLYQKLGLDLPKNESGSVTIDTEAPPLEGFQGLQVRAFLGSEENFYRGKDGKPILENGKPVSRGFQIKANLEGILRVVGQDSVAF